MHDDHLSLAVKLRNDPFTTIPMATGQPARRNMPQREQPLVLLVGGSMFPQTLVLAQRLHRAGIGVVIVDQEKVFQYDVPFVQDWRFADGSPAALKNELESWLDHPQLRLVLPLSESVMVVCEEVFKGTGLLMNERCTVPLSVLLSKSAMIEQAQAAGLNVPRSQVVTDLDHALERVNGWGYPVMLKGDGGLAGTQVLKCNDAQALRAAHERLQGCSPISLQEYVDGEVWVAGAFFEGGVVRRIHIFSRLAVAGGDPFGPSERIRHESAPQALDHLVALGRHLNWNGFGQIDFICRPDGELFFLEFNPRPWGSITAADAAGNDIFGALVQWVLGDPVTTDLDNRSAWSGLVYPKPVQRLIQNQDFLGILWLLLKGDLHRSRPTHSWSRELEACFMREAYWTWSRERQRRL